MSETVYGAPPIIFLPRSQNEPPPLEMVYGAPPVFPPRNQGGPPMPAPVYGAPPVPQAQNHPPVPAPVYGAPPINRNRNALIIGILTVLLAVIVTIIVMSKL
jgi:hypothetical protein